MFLLPITFTDIRHAHRKESLFTTFFITLGPKATNQWLIIVYFVDIAKCETRIGYQHNIEGNLETEDGFIKCILRNPQLKDCFPKIATFLDESYIKNVSSIVFNLRRFC